MRLVTFEIARQPRPGVLAGDGIIDPQPLGTDLRGLETKRDRGGTRRRHPAEPGDYCALTPSSAGTPSVRQSVLFCTMPSNEASFTCAMRGSAVPIAGPPSAKRFAAATIMRRNCATARSLEPG